MDREWMFVDRLDSRYREGVEYFVRHAMNNAENVEQLFCPCVKCGNNEYVDAMLPEGNELPRRTYDAKKILCPMGVDYVKIHACRNDCILFRKDYKELDKCPKCGSSRYKLPKKNSTNSKGVPVKVLWYLPIIPRFKRMFANLKEARNLIWHAGGDGRILDDKIRHPTDSTQWKSIDHLFPEFGSDARNLRLGLCTDGMNPFGNLSSQWSTWPVLLTIYNLPPWLCMKRKYLMLSLLIYRPKQPGNDIDVYLEPLMDDLKLLWDEGVEVYDAYRGETLNLRAMIFCTINDFPAYGNLSGYTVKGAKACPIFEEDTISDRLVHGGKNVYLCSRRLLHLSHPYRKKMKPFNGKQELRNPPKILSGKEVYEKVKNIENNFGKPYKRSDGTLYKKRSIFWDLPYWKHLSVRHCIDVMHVEKNVCESLIGTLLNIPGKTKDGVKARQDMAAQNIRPELAPQIRGSRTYLPPACYTLSRNEKKSVCECLHGVKVPQRYSSNIRNLVSMKDLKLVGLKSHDCHTLMQQLLPVALRGVLPNHVRGAIIRLCYFFNAIFSKVVNSDTLFTLQRDVITTMCELEMFFPPSFFDIMQHLVVHLVREIKICGPVFLRNMYPFERYMKPLAAYVRNQNRPEGCMIQGYIAEEALQKEKWSIVLHGKKQFVGKEAMDEVDDELPPFSSGLPPTTTDDVDDFYLRDDHEEGLWVALEKISS
ncbi:uncharacterized protein LOC141613916 [Silene latifolia]|uniref:uncharacterized protein LOC141613916 n=1 Tax=Silene latifolia TaxID=37657 RepID=UPI003D782FCC